MKHHYSLLLFLCVVMTFGFCMGQSPDSQLPHWDAPKFDEGFVKRNKIKSVEVRSYANKDLSKLVNGTRYEYDNDGNLLLMVEMQKKDTSRIHGYKYTKKGTLISKVVTDRV